MDIRIEKKKGIRALFTKKGIPYLAGALFLVFVLWLLLRDNSSTLRVDARTISVGQVVSGEFNDYIRVTGQVQPITTVQLSPLEAGIVERLVVEEGTSVKKGDVLVVLSNTSLTLEILNSEAELAYNAVAGKYDRGMVSALDLQTAANNLLQARSERLRARLQYIIKTRLVEYYNGAPLIR